MTNKKTTRRALFSSVLSLILCVSMLIGTTFAWFTDEVVSGMNTIAAGNLDVELLHSDKAVKNELVDEATTLFDDVTLWEPGAVVYENLQVANVGNLALKYALSINFANETIVNGHGLSEALKVAVVEDGFYGDREDAKELTNYQPLESFELTGELEGSQKSAIYGVVIYWQPGSDDNQFNMNNENRGQVLSIDLGVNLFATQEVYEEDSFGDDYDLNAPSLIEVNGVLYDTIEAAIEAANTNYPIMVGGAVRLAGDAGVSQVTDLQGITIKGIDSSAVLIFENAAGSNNTGTGTFSNMNLKDIVVVDETFYTSQNGENAWEFTYLEIGGENTFENVVFTDGIMVEDGFSVFENCTFIGHNNDSSDYGNGTMYGAWVYGGEASFSKCYFTGTRGLKVADQYNANVTKVVVDDCVFGPLSEKPGIAVDNRNDSLDLTIENSTFIGTQPGKLGNYIYEDENTTPNVTNITLENNTVQSIEGLSINGDEYIITSANGMMAFASLANMSTFARTAAVNTFAGKTVKLGNDIDMLGYVWTPIAKFCGTFDGQGYTISNLKISGTSSVGFFGQISSATVKNVAFDNATVTGNHYVGVVFGYEGAESVQSYITNCTITNSVITCDTDASNDNGDKVGGIGGYATTTTITDCSISDSVITAYRDAGGILGYANLKSKVSGCSATNVDMVWDNEVNYKNYGSVAEADLSIIVGEASGSVTVPVETEDFTDVTKGLNAGNEVILTEDVKGSASKGGYSNAGAVQNGGTLDGNGNTLTVEDANGTWDCAVYTKGGTIKNLTINGAFRGIFTAGCSADIIIDNVVIDKVCYTISSDVANPNYSIIVSNSTLNGWTSYTKGYKSVSFTDCNFGKGTGSYQYAYMRPYSETTLTGCVFEEGFEFDARQTTSTFVNCYVGDQLITADNIVTLLGEDAANAVVANN